MNNVYTLGIESSCDETAAGVYSSQNGLIAHQLHSQASLHRIYGGVVPELASRDHIKRVLPLVSAALAQAKIVPKQLSGVAYTAGPGLAGALLVGAGFAKSLAFALNIPALGINHLEGHLLAPLLEANKPSFPFLCLLVSGGHSMLLHAKALGQYKLLGESLDDAAGEAFDKVAQLLGLGYPGGVVLAKTATMGDKQRFTLPRPLLAKDSLDFSFSGLKTAVRHTFLKIKNPSQQDIADICASFEHTITDVLVQKTQRALLQTGLKKLVVTGGVGANTVLRLKLASLVQKNVAELFYPRLEFCTDNGAMIALAGHLRLSCGQFDSTYDIMTKPRWGLDKLEQAPLFHQH